MGIFIGWEFLSVGNFCRDFFVARKFLEGGNFWGFLGFLAVRDFWGFWGFWGLVVLRVESVL